MTTATRAVNRPAVNLTLLALTVVTTFLTYLVVWSGARGLEVPGAAAKLAAFLEDLRRNPQSVRDSLAFSAAIIGILGCHEMGHYLFARRHQVDSSLPYFIPVPLLGFGTMGAVIRLRSRIPTRNALVDIGAAGPLAGLAVAIPVLIAGYLDARIEPLPGNADLSDTFPGSQSLFALLARLPEWLGEASGQVGPEATRQVTYFGDNLLLLGIQHLLIGPIPAGHDVIVGPLVIAGWFGLLVTMLNLLPIGQLDGGHLSHAMLGPVWAPRLGRLTAAFLMLLCCFFSLSWLLWLVVTSLVIGFRHPEVTHLEEPLSLGRRVVCWLCAAALVACVMPVPIRMITL